MNIWIFNHYADTPDRQATRTYDLSKKLVDRGHTVTIFAAGFSHYSFREEKLRAGEHQRQEERNGVRFIWLRTFPYRRNNWRRIVNMVSYAWRAFWAARKLQARPDAIIGVSVHPLAALCAYLVARMRGSRFFFEVTDLWPEVLVQFDLLSPNSPLTWLLRLLERFLYRRAERILMIWPRTEAYLAAYGVPSQKLVWLPHMADLDRYKTLSTYNGEIGAQFTVMYLGSFNHSTGTWIVPQAARLLKQRGVEVRFVLVGGGTGGNDLRELSRRIGAENVEFRGLVPKQELSTVMEEADAFLVTLKDVPLLQYGISLNKICDYLASGKPTIMAGSPGYDPIREARAGMSVPAEDPAALADAVERLIKLTPEERVAMGQNGRQYLERVHDIHVLADRLENTLLQSSAVDPSFQPHTTTSKTEANAL